MVANDGGDFKESLRNPQTVAEAVQLYSSLGWSFFPLRPKDKLPYSELLPVKVGADGEPELTASGNPKHTWEPFQEDLPKPETVAAWLKRSPGMNLAIVCGAVSGIIVLDIDSPEGEALAAEKGLPRTPVVKTGKGHHYYFKHPGMVISNFAKRLPGIDLRGDGGYVVSPPSVHPSGAVYTWEVGPEECDLAEMPDWLLALATGERPEEKKSEPPRRQERQEKAESDEKEDMPEAYYADIAQALGVVSYDGEAWSNAVRCPVVKHEHDHVRPAAHWHREKKILKCFKCHGGQGEYYLAKEVAEAVGVDWRNYRRAASGERRAASQEPPATSEEEWAAMGAAPPDMVLKKAEGQISPLEMVRGLLERIQASTNGDRAGLVQECARLIVKLSAVHQVELSKALRAVTGFTAGDVKKILEEAASGERRAASEKQEEGQGGGQYWVQDGCIVRFAGEDTRRVATFVGRYVAESSVDYGDGFDAQLIADLEITLRDGRKYTVQVPTEDTGDAQKMTKLIRGVAGVAASVEANEQKHLCPALDCLSVETVITRSREIAHTGWAKTDGGWAYVTPGGVVGELPAGVVVRLRDDSARIRADLDAYKVIDEGDEAWKRGIEALWGLAFAFEAEITFPALAFAFLPVLGRFLPERSKFVLHLVGRTGTLKTSFAQAVMSLYGEWAFSKPTFMWESTPNSIEKGGFPLKDVLALVDDYKPEIVAEGTIISFIQRYTAGTGRGRLDRASRLMADRPFRAWMMSTGEDMPTSVPSVMSRVISLRLRPRETGQAVNEDLQKAQAGADGLKTVMARFVGWVQARGEGRAAGEDFSSELREEMEQIRRVVVQGIQEDVPNRDRIAENVALLVLAWRWVRTFLREQGVADVDAFLGGFDVVDGVLGTFARAVVGSATHMISSGRPSVIFLDTLAALMDKKMAFIVARTAAPKDTPMNVVGWFDPDGSVYLGSQAYEDVERYLRMSGGSVGCSRTELHRLLAEEGKLAGTGRETTALLVRCGGMNRRVLKFRPGVIEVPMEQGGGEE